MHLQHVALSFLLQGALALPSPDSSYGGSKYVNWRTSSFTGVNLGGWLVQEVNIDTAFYTANFANTSSEWDFCTKVGLDKCGPVLDKRYETWIDKSQIDTLAKSGVTILRIPTTYAAWVKVPGSFLYTGSQKQHLRTITDYAIKKHGMHIVIDLHSLPGGINGLEIGERFGGRDWFNNATNLAYSYETIEAVLKFIQKSESPQSFSLEPMNEPADNPNFAYFGTAASLTTNGTAYVLEYYKGVVARTKKVNAKIPVMLHDAFKGESFFSPSFNASENIVFDVHNYYFPAARNATSANEAALICSDAKSIAGDGKFPVFLGEWSVQTATANELSLRERNVKTTIKAYLKYARGSAMWSARYQDTTAVVGQGTLQDYWSWENFAKLGFFNKGRKEQGLTCS